MTIQEYMSKHPDLVANFDSDPGYAQAYGSLSGYILADMRANGSPEERSWAAADGQRSLDATRASDGNLNAIDNAIRQGAERAGAGGNTNQVQGGYQQGSFNSDGTQRQTGNTNQRVTGNNVATGAQTTIQDTNGVQTNQGTQKSDSVQNTNQNTSGVTQTQGTNRTTGQTVENINQTTNKNDSVRVQDALGFGQMLKDQAPAAQQNDAVRSGVLQDVATTGGSQFNDQLMSGISKALSGPGMQGVGNGALGRVAGSASADIGRNNLNQRLQATQQLSGPTAVTQLAAAGNPFLGSDTTGSATTTGQNVTNVDQTNTIDQTQRTNQNTQGTTQNQGTVVSDGRTTDSTRVAGQNNSVTGTVSDQNSIGFTDMLNTEKNTGSSQASSAQVATGQVPEGKTTSSGGGCVVCSTYADLGQMHPGAIRRGVKYKLDNLTRYARNVAGYMLYGPILVKFVQASPRFAKVFKPLARGILYEECRLASPTRHKFRVGPYVSHKGFVWVSNIASFVGQMIGHTGKLEDQHTTDLLTRNNLYFNWRNS